MTKPFIVTDSSDQGQVSKAQRENDDRENDVRFILSEPRGRRWAYDLIFDKCHVLGNSFVPEGATGTAYNEGVRNLGVNLYNQIKDNQPKLFMKMLEENHFDE
tara:strand:- start:93 stop:401 length:309 start_codon:yes stop_codon:yes gene_type:complete